MSIVLGILTFALIVLSLFLVLIVLAQKAKSDGGVGAAMGGGMTEAAFGADTGNVLSKATIYAAVAFFVINDDNSSPRLDKSFYSHRPAFVIADLRDDQKASAV